MATSSLSNVAVSKPYQWDVWLLGSLDFVLLAVLPIAGVDLVLFDMVQNSGAMGYFLLGWYLPLEYALLGTGDLFRPIVIALPYVVAALIGVTFVLVRRRRDRGGRRLLTLTAVCASVLEIAGVGLLLAWYRISPGELPRLVLRIAAAGLLVLTHLIWYSLWLKRHLALRSTSA